MPFIYRRPRRTTRRLRRRTLRKRSTAMVPRFSRPSRRIARPSRQIRCKWANPLDRKQLVKFKYADAGYTLGTVGVANFYDSHIFRGNSLYDPDQTGVGVQPYGYDEYCALFNGRYKVYASKIKVSFYLSEASYGCLVGVYPARSEYSYHDSSDLRVTRGSRYRMLSSGTGITGRNTVYAYSTTRQNLPIIGDDSTYASVGANPTNTWVWVVYANSESLAEELSIYFDVQITYYARLSKLENLNES